MAKQEFTVEHNGKVYRCFEESGKVWIYDEKGHPYTVDGPFVIKVGDREKIAVDILNAYGK